MAPGTNKRYTGRLPHCSCSFQTSVPSFFYLFLFFRETNISKPISDICHPNLVRVPNTVYCGTAHLPELMLTDRKSYWFCQRKYFFISGKSRLHHWKLLFIAEQVYSCHRRRCALFIFDQAYVFLSPVLDAFQISVPVFCLSFSPCFLLWFPSSFSAPMRVLVSRSRFLLFLLPILLPAIGSAGPVSC